MSKNIFSDRQKAVLKGLEENALEYLIITYKDWQLPKYRKALLNALKENQSVRVVKAAGLSDSPNERAIADIISHLENHPNIIGLDVSHNKLTAESIRRICTALPQIKALDVSGTTLDTASLSAISKMNLEFLNVSACHLDEKAAIIFADMNSLKALNISNNLLGSRGASYIARMRYLDKLNIAGNNIGNDGAKAVSGMKNLSELDISSNRIDNSDAVGAIAEMNQLTALSIGENGFGSDGVLAIAKMDKLESLSIAFVRIGDEAAKAIARMKALISLDIYNTSGSADTNRAYAVMGNLKTLNIAGNYLDAQTIEAFEQHPNIEAVIYSSHGHERLVRNNTTRLIDSVPYGERRVCPAIASDVGQYLHIAPPQIQLENWVTKTTNQTSASVPSL
jgi:hypothetical protein